MALWSEEKISKWEEKFFGRKLTVEEYEYIFKNEPGYALLLFYVWDRRGYNKYKSNDAERVFEEVGDNVGKYRLEKDYVKKED